MLIIFSIILLVYIITFVSAKYRTHIVPLGMENFISTIKGPLQHNEKNQPEPHEPGLHHPGPLPPHSRPKPHPRGIKPPPPLPKPMNVGFEHNKPEPGSKKIFIIFSIVLFEAIVTIILTIFGLKALAIIAIFIMTMILILSRFGELNEAYPAAIGAVIVLMTGIVNNSNLIEIVQKIGGASTTIIATLVMAIVLESFGFFHWAASKLVYLSKGSGYRLYFLIQILCFLMTILFNNDGSILITTPILILLLNSLQLKPHEKIPYLISGALIATSSSAPIGVSNIVNLISLNIVHMTLFSHTTMMFIPSTIGLIFMSIVMFVLLKNRIPREFQAPSGDIEELFFTNHRSPSRKNSLLDSKQNRTGFMFKILAYIIGIRCMIFIASYLGIPIEIVAVGGSLILLFIRWYYLHTDFKDVIKKAPWHILIFALSMYIIIYGLHNIGLTNYLGSICKPLITGNLFNASFIMGGLTTILSNMFNNHPALMIVTIVITNMALDPITLKLAYLSDIIGSDIGSLLLPIGTLASLLWMFILKKNGINISWKEYVKVTVIVIPLTVIFTLFILYFWIQMVFK